MSGDFSPEFQRELLEDFHSEADELFRQVRAHLVTLERQPRDAAVVESLYRTVHSFKGICGIVGLRAAEELAHATEDLLRGVSRGRFATDADTIDLLARSAHRLEQIVAAHRAGHPLPTSTDLLEDLRPFQSTAPVELPALAPEPEPPPAASADLAGWHALFVPSRELDARGVNVTSIRGRLAALAPIVSATPVVRPGAGMVFDFALALAEPPADLASWTADGVEWQASIAPAKAPASETTTSAALSIAPSHLVRVDLGRLDELMRIMGEMVVHRSRLDDRIARLDQGRAELQEVASALARSLRDLRGAITRVRLVPVAEIFTRMPFVVKDVARENGKNVRLLLEGQDTEIDKFLVERLKEPLLHLVRNAIGHGIESPADRAAAGKPEQATLTLRAFAAGQTVVIEVADDGRGIDVDAVIARAREQGAAVPEAPDNNDLLEIICGAGFSTRSEADRTSGRGVGMAVVQTTIRELGGRLSLNTQRGEGARFTLRLPLTLSIADVVIVSAAGQTCAVPQSAIVEVLQFEESDVHSVKQTEVIPYRDGVLPIVRLSKTFGTATQTRVRIPVLVIHSERGSTGLVVDRVHTQREVVVRQLADPLVQVRGVMGATELGDGRPVLILDPNALTEGIVRPHATRGQGRAEEPKTA